MKVSGLSLSLEKAQRSSKPGALSKLEDGEEDLQVVRQKLLPVPEESCQCLWKPAFWPRLPGRCHGHHLQLLKRKMDATPANHKPFSSFRSSTKTKIDASWQPTLYCMTLEDTCYTNQKLAMPVETFCT